MSNQKSLQVLMAEVREHYESRGFSQQAIDELLKSIKHSHRPEGYLVFPRTGRRCDIATISGKFQPINQQPASEDELGNAAAIFAFAFGYRLKSRPVHGAEARLPGKNNRALAGIVAELKDKYTAIPAYVQFEIADALQERDPPACPYYATPAEDISTREVLKYFMRNLGWWKLTQGNGMVIVVAHAHHVGRCILFLDALGLKGLLPPALYADYDPWEEQTRVKNQVDYIHSDFPSLVSLFSS